jgi:hypothetical protein
VDLLCIFAQKFGHVLVWGNRYQRLGITGTASVCHSVSLPGCVSGGTVG